MSVSSIFKILLGTILTIVISSIVIELFNISTTGVQLQHVSRMSAKQAAELFSQETYKKHTDSGSVGGSVNEKDLRAADGSVYVNGKFYESEDPRTIYDGLYTSNEFKQWLLNDAAAQKGNWYNLKLISNAVNNPSSLNVPFGQPGHDEAMLSKLYNDVMMTPSNLGIPYLDLETVNRMFKWNLTQLLTNCSPESIQRDAGGSNYVSYKGFKIHADMAFISNLEYRTFDLADIGDRATFNRITNIDPDKLGFEFDTNLTTNTGTVEDERQRVCLVGIQYAVPMTYMGITPLSSIFNYVWNTEVDGINGGSGRTTHQQWTENTQNMVGGGLDGFATTGVLPVPGKLIYYIIK